MPQIDRSSLFIILISLLFTDTSRGDNFYKYVEDGREWYTNKCPAGKKCTLVMKGTKVKQSQSQSNSRNADKIPKNERFDLYNDIIEEHAETYQIPVALIHAVIMVESGYQANAVSPKGAQGLMQLMPQTADRMGVKDPFDPYENIMGGVKYLRFLANKFGGDMVKTLSGYHAGENAVEKAGGIPYIATRDYVVLVLRHYKKFKEIYPDGK